MRNLTFKTKILLVSLLPLVIVSILIILIAGYQAKQLGTKNIASFSDKIFELRRSELQNYTEIAKTTFDYFSGPDYNDQLSSEEQAKEVMRHMRYASDGYFFAYDRYTTLVHPTVPSLEGNNQRDMVDPNGVRLIEELYERAIDGGGFTSYVWLKPSRGREVEKISYSVQLRDWKWWIGTGLYVDDLEDAILAIEETVDENIATTLQIITALALASALLVGFIGARVTLSEGKLADGRLKQLSQKAVEGQEEERRRVALSLQKGIIQPMSFIRAKIRSASIVESLKEEKARKDFTVVLAALNKTVKEVYRISGELRPETLDKHGLFPALEELVEKASAESSIEFILKKTENNERLDSDIETAVYRIAQEAINNIITHSDADKARLRIRQDQHLLSFSIQDDGVGFETKSVFGKNSSAGVGFVDMRVRAESLGGHLSVFSSKGTGTILKIEIPIG